MKEKFLQRLIYGPGRVLILLLLTVFSAMAQDGALNKRTSISLKNDGLSRSLEILQQRSGITFFYNPAELSAVTKKYTVSFDNKTVQEILSSLLQSTGLEFEAADNKKIVIRKIVIQQKTPALRKWRTVTGEVRDAKKNTPVGGVEILVQSTGNHITADAAGKFAVEVKDTVDVLILYFVGYATKTVKVGDKEILNISITQDSKTLGGVTVEARRRTNTEASLLNDRKNSAIISDGISAQNIEKTASITTTQALQRVSGVTITDEKYVAIRGLGDRSVIGQLNGVRLASSDPDRSAIPLDLIPASLLDNITVYKTSSPDKPADASAGIVELKTKSIPEHETFNITIQSGFNTQVGLDGKVNSFYNSETGFLGQKVKDKGLSNDFLNLSKQYPNGLKDIQDKIAASRNDPALLTEANRINGIMHEFLTGNGVLHTIDQVLRVNQ